MNLPTENSEEVLFLRFAVETSHPFSLASCSVHALLRPVDAMNYRFD